MTPGAWLLVSLVTFLFGLNFGFALDQLLQRQNRRES